MPLVSTRYNFNIRLTTALFSQQTGLALQVLPLPIPTTSIGEQWRPMRALRSCTTIPKGPRRAAPAAEPAYRGISKVFRQHMDGSYGLSSLAALDGASAASTRAAAARASATGDVHGGGDRKDGESEGCESSELRKHIYWDARGFSGRESCKSRGLVGLGNDLRLNRSFIPF